MPKPPLEEKDAKLTGRVKSDFPKHTLQEALRVPQALEDASAGQPLPPIETAAALKMSPGSLDFRVILSSAIKYGLTSGSFNSHRVSLEEIGRNIVEATGEEGKRKALVQAALNPPTFNAIYLYLRGKKLPDATFFENTVVREFKVPRDHAKKCVEIFNENVEYARLVRTLPTGKWVSTETVGLQETAEAAEGRAQAEAGEAPEATPVAEAAPAKPAPAPAKPKVFIAHGKSPQIANQLKDLLTFGNFESVVAEEYETTAKPIPDKVVGLMRQCSAAIIHVASEEQLLDSGGTLHHKLNENVLIEIGASMALYGRKFILLVQKGLHLPSNLSGLYCCFYEGDKLDYEATMKLLKAFTEFRTQ
jgi:predicted nucleotide-binding protein